MAISELAKQVLPADSSNFTPGRAKYSDIREITLHHMAGFMSVEELADMWQNPQRDGSSHYGINGNDIACYVSEGDIAWTNGNWEANCRAVTIEIANSTGAPNWEISNDSLNSAIALVADIAKRNNLGALIPFVNLTMHKQYSATACPGPYLQEKFTYIAEKANEINEGSSIGTLTGEIDAFEQTFFDFIGKIRKHIDDLENIYIKEK